jgi:Ase1/PRC1/MAP65 family protein
MRCHPQVLPKRFEHLTVYQDKLQQLYQTKLEQLQGLNNKINKLVRVVGPGFFGPDITCLTPAQGVQSDEEHQALRDVTPDRFTRLEKELVRAKTEMVSHVLKYTH